MRKTIQILDIKVQSDRIVRKAVAKHAKMSSAYLTYLIQGDRTSKSALLRARNAFVELYPNFITYVPTDCKNTNQNSKKILKKTA